MIFKKIKKLEEFIKTLEKSGVLAWVKKLQKELPKSEIYLVGGAVRDAVLGVKDNKDYDFVVRRVPMEKLEKFLSKLGWVEKLGKNFGVLKFRPKGLSYKAGVKSKGLGYKEEVKPKGLSYKNRDFEPLDIALPRQEFSTKPGGYKDFKVKFNKDLKIEDDLGRRDFTINAIAVCLTPPNPPFVRGGVMADPFNGLNDIKNKIIRCVGEPEERLSEDYTRILRAVRFACQLNFKIEKKTELALKKLAPHLNDKDEKGEWIAVREVLAKEFLQTFLFEPLKALDLSDKLGLLKVLMPEVLKMKKCSQPENFHSEGDVWQHTRLALAMTSSRQFLSFEKKLEKSLEIRKDKVTQAFRPDIKDKLELIFAVLFHDIGKPLTIKTPVKDGVDRIRFDDHDNRGADLAKKICERLTLSAPAKIGISPENVAWLVKKHMMLIHGHPSQFRPTTVEKHFFSERYPGKNLIKLAYLDSLATIPKDSKLEFELIEALLARIKGMRQLVQKKKARALLPPPLLDGDEIMQFLKIKPGKRVGEIKEMLREKQLGGEVKSKKEAKEVIKKLRIGV